MKSILLIILLPKLLPMLLPILHPILFHMLLPILHSIVYTIPNAILFFPGPLAFCKKAVERVNSEKNILNSSVECVEWFF